MAQQQTLGTHATTVKGSGNLLRVTYHSTDVVTADSNRIVLDTGGYFTNTTKTRMNQASNQFGLGFTVQQKKGEWLVFYKDQTIKFEGDLVEFNR
jgi:hypothetical protein